MNRKSAVTLTLLAALFTSVATLTVERWLRPSPLVAQEAASPLNGISVFANSYGTSTGSVTRHFRGFIFVNQQTGDIWVYRNEEPQVHYRVRLLGQNLEEIR